MLLNQKIFYLSSEAPTVYFVASRLLAVTGGNFSGSAAASMQPVTTNYSVTVTKPDATTSTFTVTPAANGLASFTLPLIGYQQGTWTWSAVNAATSTATDYAWGLFYWGDTTYAALNTNASTAATQATNAAADSLTAKTSVTAGGYVATRTDTTNTNVSSILATTVTGGAGTLKDNLSANYATLVTGGAGTVKDNASTAATAATAASLDASQAALNTTNSPDVYAEIDVGGYIHTQLHAGGTVYDGALRSDAQLQAGGAVYDNALDAATQATAAAASAASADIAATNAETQATAAATAATVASDALTPNLDTPIPDLNPTPAAPPNVASQIALLYWLLSGLTRTFDPVTGRIYLDTTPIAGALPPGTQVYFQCWANVARTIPATTLAEVLVQDPITYD